MVNPLITYVYPLTIISSTKFKDLFSFLLQFQEFLDTYRRTSKNWFAVSKKLEDGK